MKTILLIATLFLLAACAQPLSSSQNVSTITPIAANKTENISVITPQEVAAPIDVIANESEPKTQVYYKTINGTKHTIEVIDVTSDGKGCLLKVDGTTVLINEGMTQKVNGVRIHVLEVRAFKSKLEDQDVCQIIIG